MGVEGYLATELAPPEDFELEERARVEGINPDVYVFTFHVEQAIAHGAVVDLANITSWWDYFADNGATLQDVRWMITAIDSTIERYA